MPAGESRAPDFEKLLGALHRADVEFILVGGVAAVVHGSSRATYDLDLVYSRDPGNLQRLALALEPFEPYLRGLPRGFRSSSIRRP
jgi:hypothetical protein